MTLFVVHLTDEYAGEKGRDRFRRLAISHLHVDGRGCRGYCPATSFTTVAEAALRAFSTGARVRATHRVVAQPVVACPGCHVRTTREDGEVRRGSGVTTPPRAGRSCTACEAGRRGLMGSLCSCLCNQAGHVGRCRELAESGLYLPEGQPRIRPVGVVCRPCYQAALGRLRDPREVTTSVVHAGVGRWLRPRHEETRTRGLDDAVSRKVT